VSEYDHEAEAAFRLIEKHVLDVPSGKYQYWIDDEASVVFEIGSGMRCRRFLVDRYSLKGWGVLEYAGDGVLTEGCSWRETEKVASSLHVRVGGYDSDE